MMKKSVYISLLSEQRDGAASGCQAQFRAAASLTLEGFDDSSSGNKDKPEAADDEDFIFVPCMNQMI